MITTAHVEKNLRRFTRKEGSQRWFAEPLGTQANKMIGSIEGAAAVGPTVCADGEHHNLWELPRKESLIELHNSRKDVDFEFNAFTGQGDGKPVILDVNEL